MASPIGLTIKNNINDMIIGDCIPCRYTATTSGVAGYFSELGTCIANEIPIGGTATPNGLFYLIKTTKGTLIADRVVQTNISWDVLSTAKFIEGSTNSASPTKILMHMEESVIKDEVGGHTIIATGVTLDSTVKKFGNSSSKFNKTKTTSQIVPNNQDLDFGTGDFTIDFWIYQNSHSFYMALLDTRKTNYSDVSYDITENGSTGLLQVNKGPSLSITCTSQISLNAWHHIALVRYKGVASFYIDGSSIGSFLDPNFITGLPLSIGNTYLQSDSNNYCLDGYIDEFRVTKGLAKWVSDFIPNISPYLLDIPNHKIRSLSGGCAYTDANCNSSLTDKSLGAWPNDNEWDKYIVSSDLKGKITKGDDNVWHYNPLWSWCKETGINGLVSASVSSGISTDRIFRGYLYQGRAVNRLDNIVSSNSGNGGGFRPVLNYVESDITNEVIY